MYKTPRREDLSSNDFVLPFWINVSMSDDFQLPHTFSSTLICHFIQRMLAALVSIDEQDFVLYRKVPSRTKSANILAFSNFAVCF